MKDIVNALTKKVYNLKSAKNLDTFPPKFQNPESFHTEHEFSNKSVSVIEEEKKDSVGSGFANYSFLKAQSERSNSDGNSSSRISQHIPIWAEQGSCDS